MRKVGPDWMKSALDQRFHEMARQAGRTIEICRLQTRQRDLGKKLKDELTDVQYELILEWEEIINYRNTLEKEWLYFAGFRDGMQMWRDLYIFS